MMQPNLIGALIEREKICDLCDCPTSDWDVVEMRGSLFTLCTDCRFQNIFEISDARARSDAAGREEDEAQEEL